MFGWIEEIHVKNVNHLTRYRLNQLIAKIGNREDSGIRDHNLPRQIRIGIGRANGDYTPQNKVNRAKHSLYNLFHLYVSAQAI